jgi:plasmid stabilization system protein ParE
MIFGRAYAVFLWAYVVLYRVEGDDVVIDRVVRGRRDLEALLRD